MDVTALVVWFMPALSLDALLMSSGRYRIFGRGFPSLVNITYVCSCRGLGAQAPAAEEVYMLSNEIQYNSTINMMAIAALNSIAMATNYIIHHDLICKAPELDC